MATNLTSESVRSLLEILLDPVRPNEQRYKAGQAASKALSRLEQQCISDPDTKNVLSELCDRRIVGELLTMVESRSHLVLSPSGAAESTSMSASEAPTLFCASLCLLALMRTRTGSQIAALDVNAVSIVRVAFALVKAGDFVGTAATDCPETVWLGSISAAKLLCRAATAGSWSFCHSMVAAGAFQLLLEVLSRAQGGTEKTPRLPKPSKLAVAVIQAFAVLLNRAIQENDQHSDIVVDAFRELPVFERTMEVLLYRDLYARLDSLEAIRFLQPTHAVTMLRCGGYAQMARNPRLLTCVRRALKVIANVSYRRDPQLSLQQHHARCSKVVEYADRLDAVLQRCSSGAPIQSFRATEGPSAYLSPQDVIDNWVLMRESLRQEQRNQLLRRCSGCARGVEQLNSVMGPLRACECCRSSLYCSNASRKQHKRDSSARR